MLLPDGKSLNRAVIGQIVFNDVEERRWLNSVVHPRVRREIVKNVVWYWLSGEWCVVVDVPLLIEAGLWQWVGEVVVVYVYVPNPLATMSLTGCRNEKLQLSRLLSRPSVPPLPPAQAQARINSQLALSTKTSHATTIIDNSGTLQDLTLQVDRLVSKWRNQQGGDQDGGGDYAGSFRQSDLLQEHCVWWGDGGDIGREEDGEGEVKWREKDEDKARRLR